MCVDIASRLVYAWDGRAVAGSQARILVPSSSSREQAQQGEDNQRRSTAPGGQNGVAGESDGGSVFIRSR
ncbi:hypothetical protein CBS63078_9998 [Aspergillus niger]|nr:hypothetical protein CBS133816_9275 [Aspergillus niger]KAI2886492.1 hypothetical protein CBS13152_7134 [Aspergillus niger]KAI2890576.1 hypothetical protein CBS63078_9998 [Aspergillus niger]KAI2892264.1 hypothetical protein CBS11852_5880 [Aspergillus niger]KAI2909508.1 hypothetical protein CBS147371_9596 [Aspergillus niger]